jgi:hypothetical protein
MIDASQYFRGRLSETFAGYDRELNKYPVHYLNACSPYAPSPPAPRCCYCAPCSTQKASTW